MGILKAMLVILSIACLVAVFATTGASARLEGRWALQVGNVVTGMDFSIQHPMAALFHQQELKTTDVEHYDLAFPAFADGLHPGPTAAEAGVGVGVGTGTGVGTDSTGIGAGSGLVPGAGATASSNIVPFGPVNLAFPDIHEDVLQTVSSTSTGFVMANWAYIADTAVGNLGSAPIGVHLPYGSPFKSKKLLGSEFLWPYMTPISRAPAGSFKMDTGDMLIGRDITDGMQSPSFTGNMSMSTPANNTTTNVSAQNTTGNTPVTSVRKPYIDPKSTKEQIQDMTILQRMERNAFVGSTMYKAYEGTVQSPTWIDPNDNPRGVFNQINMYTILDVAHKKTLPGTHIAPVFWDM